jgi:hypothetical protein
MPIEWIAISAAVAPHVKKYAAGRADRLADGALARAYRRIMPDEKLMRANEAFVTRFSKELDSAADLATLNAEPYQMALQEFMANPTVQEAIQSPLDGQSEFDWKLLRGIWDEMRLIQLPADFVWSKVAKTYRQAVMNQMLADPELRPVLSAIASMRSAEISERAAASLDRLAGPETPFDLDRYAQALTANCTHLNLGSLDSDWPQYERGVRLQSVYVPQSVKHALPPRDITRDYLRSLRERGTMRASDLYEDRLGRYRQEYARTESRNVMDVVDGPLNDRLVILGDPGLGKSTLLKLLALRWISDHTLPLALFIELRRAGPDSGHQTLLDYLEGGSSPICCLPKLATHKYLRDHDSLVLLDGLDELSEPHRSNIVSGIIRFGTEYPRSRIIVTTRVYGYFPGSTHPDEFREARFQQFTLQDFGDAEIDRFITLWHQEAFPEVSSRSDYEGRLRGAISESPAIRELSANPLLLTMMAVLSWTQDLPRDRALLYEACAQLLLKNWDLDKFPELKARKEPRDIKDKLGPAQKMRILEQVSAAMQSERTGLEGNLIAEERLQAIVQEELRILEVPQPWSVAEDLIWMLRERNFMLAYLGDQQYAFVHRTFLEYFSARDLKFRLERTRNFREGDLYEVFNKRWDQEAWQEVLRLLCGMIGVEYAEGCISTIIRHAADPDGYRAVFLAAQCLLEVRELRPIRRLRDQVRAMLTALVAFDFPYYYDPWEDTEDIEAVRRIRADAVNALIRGWYGGPEMFTFLVGIANSSPPDSLFPPAGQDLGERAREAAVIGLALRWKDRPETLGVLKNCCESDSGPDVRAAAIAGVASGWRDEADTAAWLQSQTGNEYWRAREAAFKAIAERRGHVPETIRWLKDAAANHSDGAVRAAALQELIANWADDSDVLNALKRQLARDGHPTVRDVAVKELARRWKDRDDTVSTLMHYAVTDPSEYVRATALNCLGEGWKGDPLVLSWLEGVGASSPQPETRGAAVEALVQASSDTNHLADWLRCRAIEDADPSVRQAALAGVASVPSKEGVVEWLQERATADSHPDVRCEAISQLASLGTRYPELLPWLKSRLMLVQEGEGETLVGEIARTSKGDSEALAWLRSISAGHLHADVRAQAVEEIGRGWHNDDVTGWLLELAFRDEEGAVRRTAVRAVARARRGDTRSFLKDRVSHDDEGVVRVAALEELLLMIPGDDPDLRSLLMERVTLDEEGALRGRALAELFERWPHDEQVLALAKAHISDNEAEVRETALRGLALLLGDEASVLDLAKEAIADKDPEVRQAALLELGFEFSEGDDVATLLKRTAMTDEDAETRKAAVWKLVKYGKNDTEVLNTLRDRAANDPDSSVRIEAIGGLGEGWPGDPGLAALLQSFVAPDEDAGVRQAAVWELTRGWKTDTAVEEFLSEHTAPPSRNPTLT